MTVTLEGEEPLNLWWLTVNSCPSDIVVEDFIGSIPPCTPTSMTLTGVPGGVTWMIVASPNFTPPPGFATPYEFNYTFTIDGIDEGVVATENTTWTSVKGLFK
jgi:hypothetical protein